MVSDPLTDRLLGSAGSPDSPMLIICPSCATSYNVQPEILGVNGRSVRCARCERVWRAELPQTQKLVMAAEEIAPLAPSGMLAPPPAAGAPSGPAWADNPAPPQRQAPDPPQDHAAGDAQVDPAPPAQSIAAPYDTAAPAAEADEAVPAALSSIAEGEAPPLAPADLHEGAPVVTDASSEPQDVEAFAARRARRAQERRRMRWPLARLQTAILALLVLDSALIGWRSDIVRLLPQTASFYALIGLPVNLRTLSFEAVELKNEQHDGAPVLAVQGNIVNESRRAVEVPRLKFAVRNVSGQEIYSWTAMPPRIVLPAREAVGFRSRLASPPPEGHDVLVRFLNRHDVITGVR